MKKGRILTEVSRAQGAFCGNLLSRRPRSPSRMIVGERKEIAAENFWKAMAKSAAGYARASVTCGVVHRNCTCSRCRGSPRRSVTSGVAKLTAEKKRIVNLYNFWIDSAVAALQRSRTGHSGALGNSNLVAACAAYAILGLVSRLCAKVPGSHRWVDILAAVPCGRSAPSLCWTDGNAAGRWRRFSPRTALC